MPRCVGKRHAATSQVSQGSRVLGVCVAPPTRRSTRGIHRARVIEPRTRAYSRGNKRGRSRTSSSAPVSRSPSRANTSAKACPAHGGCSPSRTTPPCRSTGSNQAPLLRCDRRRTRGGCCLYEDRPCQFLAVRTSTRRGGRLRARRALAVLRHRRWLAAADADHRRGRGTRSEHSVEGRTGQRRRAGHPFPA